MTDIEKLYYEVERIIKNNKKYKNVFEIKLEKEEEPRLGYTLERVAFNIYIGTSLVFHCVFQRNGNISSLSIDDIGVSEMEKRLEGAFLENKKVERVNALIEMVNNDK